MTAPGPMFIDLSGPSEPEPSWKRCWRGDEVLWKVFWGWFLCGHGVILGCSIGFMMIGMILGFAVSPASLNAGFAGMATGAVLLVMAIIPYAVWCSVSLWRCAKNCVNKGWGYGVRVLVTLYVISILIPIMKLFEEVLGGT